MKKVIHFDGLNGLRAIAALAVLFAHVTTELSSFGLDSYVFGSFSNGKPKSTLLSAYGVSIFFALSGFLITYLLLEEKRTREISIKNFYIRRLLRIWPLYYLYLIAAVLTALIYNIPFQFDSVLLYVFMAANIPYVFGGGFNLIAHYWSLGVEEQFYSFWPWIIKKTKSVLTVTAILCIGLILLKTTLRIIDIKFHGGEIGMAYYFLHITRFHCMLIGAVGAILYFQKNELFLRLTNNYISQAMAWIIIFLAAINKFHVISYLDNEIICVVTVILIIGQIKKSKRIINLEIPIIDFVGKISYGIYVLHPLVIFYLSKIISLSDKSSILNYLFVYIVVFISTIFVAHLSYTFFEKRFLILKEKYSAVRSVDSVGHSTS